jgi:hypothetical protein
LDTEEWIEIERLIAQGEPGGSAQSISQDVSGRSQSATGATGQRAPLQFAREMRISPTPKDFRVQGGRIRTLAIARQATVFTDLDAATFEVRKQVRGLPLVRKLFLAPDGFSVGYKQPYPQGTPAELHFIDPDLYLAGSFRLANGCTGFSHQKHQWIVACRDGAIHSFDESGSPLWTWSVPRHHRFTSPFHVAATDERIFAGQGIYLYALTPNGGLLWDWELPNRQARTYGTTVTLPGGGHFDGARQTLGLREHATADDVRQAYRRMARLTHPDLHPGDPIAATRFRAVRQACEEAMQGQGAPGGAGAVQVLFTLVMTAEIRSLSVNETSVAVGTSEGEVYLFDHDGKVLKHHADLGRGVDSVLLHAGGLQAAFCHPRVFRFDDDSPRPSNPIAEYGGQLVACGEDSLLWYWKTMRLFDSQARVKATRIWDRKIDGVVWSGRETILLSGGYVRAIPQG